jgi:hypothetical protein
VRTISIERNGETYVARLQDEIVWSVELPLEMSASPFREEVVWPSASTVVVAGGGTVHFLSAESGAVMKTLSLDGDFFGHFGPADDVLFILGWRNVVAVDKTLTVRWVSKGVAVDGITWRGREGNRIQISTEMDPPGGWVDVVLDALTGREIARETRTR